MKWQHDDTSISCSPPSCSAWVIVLPHFEHISRLCIRPVFDSSSSSKIRSSSRPMTITYGCSFFSSLLLGRRSVLLMSNCSSRLNELRGTLLAAFIGSCLCSFLPELSLSLSLSLTYSMKVSMRVFKFLSLTSLNACYWIR